MTVPDDDRAEHNHALFIFSLVTAWLCSALSSSNGHKEESPEKIPRGGQNLFDKKSNDVTGSRDEDMQQFMKDSMDLVIMTKNSSVAALTIFRLRARYS